MRLSTHVPISVAALLVVPLGCDPEPPTPEDGPCVPHDAPTASIGRGAGGAFVELADGEDVPISVAPQGGFGVSVVIRTDGLRAEDYSFVTATQRVMLGEELIGEFTLYQQPLLCADDGGRLAGVVVGFDPSRYGSNDALVALDGQLVDLQLDISDDEGGVAEARKSVTIRVGG